MVIRKLYILEGKLISPIIASSPLIKKGRIWTRIVRELETGEKPLKSYIGKLVKGERKAPEQLQAYRGFVQVICIDSNGSRAKKNISQYLNYEYLGCHVNEGFGKVKWLNYKEEDYQKVKSKPKRTQFRIRKGLGSNYPKELQRLLIALMLHDFVKTEKHMSKIYTEIAIEDEEIREACKNHHNRAESKNNLLHQVKYYDRLAASMTRKRTLKTFTRYDYENGKIYFEKLAKEIEERQQSAYKLYHYIYHSEELNRIVESMRCVKKSLKNHLLLMVNLAIGDYLSRKTARNNGKIISMSVRKREEKLQPTKDAEMHLFSSMSNADPESPSNSRKGKARNIAGGKDSGIKTVRI